MPNNPTAQWQPSRPESLARQFSSLGWTGFWIQLVLISIPILLLVYFLFSSGPESAQHRGIDLTNYLSYGSLLVMLFTTVWFYRYTRLAKRIADPDLRPAQSSVIHTLWVGLWASSLGIFFSMLLLFSAVGRVLFVLMANPQTGVQIQSLGGDPATSLSAMDAASLTSLLIILRAELIVMAFTLWLLSRVTRSSAESNEAVV